MLRNWCSSLVLTRSPDLTFNNYSHQVEHRFDLLSPIAHRSLNHLLLDLVTASINYQTLRMLAKSSSSWPNRVSLLLTSLPLSKIRAPHSKQWSTPTKNIPASTMIMLDALLLLHVYLGRQYRFDGYVLVHSSLSVSVLRWRAFFRACVDRIKATAPNYRRDELFYLDFLKPALICSGWWNGGIYAYISSIALALSWWWAGAFTKA